MSNTANTSLAQVKKAEEDASKMITQAQKARDEKITKQQTVLQKKYSEAEDLDKESIKTELTQYKNEVTDKGKQMMHEAKKEAEQLGNNLNSKVELATQQGVNILKGSLSL